MPFPQSSPFHSFKPFLPPVTLFLLLTATTVPTASTSTPLHPRRIRVNFITPSAPASPATGLNTQQSTRTMMFVIFGVLGGLVFLALCCYGAIALLKAYKRRQVRAANTSINTRRSSTDSVWGIPENPRHDNPYDIYAPGSTLEKELGGGGGGGYPHGIESPHDIQPWNRSPAAYHEAGYAGLPTYDLEKQYIDVPPAVPPKNTVKLPKRDTTSAIIEERFGPAVINREVRSSYESYRSVQAAPSIKAPPPQQPRSSQETTRSKPPRRSGESARSGKAQRIKMVPRSTAVPATPLRPPPPQQQQQGPMTFL